MTREQADIADRLLGMYACRLGATGVEYFERLPNIVPGRPGHWMLREIPVEGAAHVIPEKGFGLAQASALAVSLVATRYAGTP